MYSDFFTGIVDVLLRIFQIFSDLGYSIVGFLNTNLRDDFEAFLDNAFLSSWIKDLLMRLLDIPSFLDTTWLEVIFGAFTFYAVFTLLKWLLDLIN